MAFVRTKRVGHKEYRQLVENNRENGKHRQRVLAHLGKHSTLEEAIEAARAKLKAVDTEKLREAQHRRQLCEEQIRSHFGDQIERYHNGEIPSRAEVTERARLHPVPYIRVTTQYVNYLSNDRQEVEVSEEVEEYRRAFGRVEKLNFVCYYGSRYSHRGLREFVECLRSYESAARVEHVSDSRKARLEKLETALNSGNEYTYAGG